MIARGIGTNISNGEIQVLNVNYHKKGKRNNFKWKKGKDNHNMNSNKRRRDMSRVQCFRCDKFIHLDIKFLDKIKHQASLSKVSKDKDVERLIFYSTLLGEILNSKNTCH